MGVSNLPFCDISLALGVVCKDPKSGCVPVFGLAVGVDTVVSADRRGVRVLWSDVCLVGVCGYGRVLGVVTPVPGGSLVFVWFSELVPLRCVFRDLV
jgi:hypothetical protein